MLTSASKSAARSVIFLAQNSGNGKKFGAAEIAQTLGLSTYFVAKLLQQLAKKNLISSAKGPQGGFYMSEENLNFRMCDVISVMEIKNVFDSCFLGLPKCDSDSPCPLHSVYMQFKNNVLDRFEHQTISEFTSQIKENETIF